MVEWVQKSTHFTVEQLSMKQRHVYMKMQFMTKVKFKISREMTDYSTNSIVTVDHPFGGSDTFIIPSTQKIQMD